MAGQNVERREVLRALSLAASAALSPNFSRWVFAGSGPDEAHATHGSAPTPRGGPYVPQFFSTAEYAAIAALTERIIPTDETPGAREAGVSEFVDFMVWSDPTVQGRFRTGLVWVETRAQDGHGKAFASLRAQEQDAILTTMAESAPALAKEEGAALRLQERDAILTTPAEPAPREAADDAATFFLLIRRYTVMGFYTSKVGMEQIGDPRLKTHYTEAPGCPHLDDPEHRKLRPGRG